MSTSTTALTDWDCATTIFDNDRVEFLKKKYMARYITLIYFCNFTLNIE